MFLRLLVPVVALLVSQNVLAQVCDVPVCDIPGTIETLKKQTSEDRQSFLSNLYQNNVNTRTPAVLRNLHDFGAEAYKLAQQLNDSKVVFQWAANVRQLGQGLLIYADFRKEEFIATYTETAAIPELSRDSQQRVRFSALYRWKLEVPVLLDVQTVYQVYDYILAASKLSQQLNDEDYIIREANMVLELLSARVSYLYPLYEGVFAIKATCVPVTTICEQKDTHSDRLVVMNSLTDLEVYTALSISKKASFSSVIGEGNDAGTSDSEVNFLFVKSLIEKNGTALYSKSDVLTVGVRPSEIKADFAGNQDVVGNAVTSRNTGALNFAGNVVFSPLKYYVDELPVLTTQQPITGEFTGRLGEYPVRVIIRQRVDKTLMASAFVKVAKGEVKKIDFSMGQYVPHRQLIQLTGVGQSNFIPYKMSIAYRMGVDARLHWFGGFYSVTGYVKDVTFDYVGPVSEL